MSAIPEPKARQRAHISNGLGGSGAPAPVPVPNESLFQRASVSVYRDISNRSLSFNLTRLSAVPHQPRPVHRARGRNYFNPKIGPGERRFKFALMPQGWRKNRNRRPRARNNGSRSQMFLGKFNDLLQPRLRFKSNLLEIITQLRPDLDRVAGAQRGHQFWTHI